MASPGTQRWITSVPESKDTRDSGVLCWGYSGVNMGAVHRMRLFLTTSLRRAGESLTAAFLLILLAPLLLALSLAIVAESRGSPILSQTRVGKNFEPFQMYKFRTMYRGAENLHGELMNIQQRETGNFLLNTDRDKRRTPLGTILRRAGIDELPQLINVLNGTMSYVGPRPMLPVELPHLDERFHARFLLSPGITGLGQIGCRPSTSLERHFTLDLYYVRHRSPRLYWKVLLMTPLIALRGL